MRGLTRREFLAGAVATGALVARPGWAGAAPATYDGTIRVLNLGYDMLDPIVKQAERDLGLQIVSRPEFPPVIQRLVRQEPASFDIFSCAQQDVAEFWASTNLQPAQIAKIGRWQQVTPLYKLGKAQPGTASKYGQGDAAFRRLYVDPERSGRWPGAPGTPPGLGGLLVQWVDESTGRTVGPEPPFCTGVPGTFNFDSFGYNAAVVRKRPVELSWAELLNVRWKRRVALNGVDPQGGLQDTANAVQAAGLMKFGDLGDPTRTEIDRLVKLLLVYRKRGQFFNIWTDGRTQPVNWLRAGTVVLSTMYASQIASLAALGFPIEQAAPREGYRAFGGLLSISSEVRDPAKLEACYAFLSWWHSGFAGAVLLREGYYSAVQATSRRFMAPGEYAYWIEGARADRTYPGPFGDKSVAKGQVRDGGSFAARAARISSWNSTPREQQYFLARWHEFIASF